MWGSAPATAGTGPGAYRERFPPGKQDAARRAGARGVR
jgi:hypothetical protein